MHKSAPPWHCNCSLAATTAPETAAAPGIHPQSSDAGRRTNKSVIRSAMYAASASLSPQTSPASHYSIQWLLLLVMLALHTAPATTTYISGEFHTADFFQFLIKFGFQKADPPSALSLESNGYIYGNITSHDAYKAPVTLVVLDKSTFVDFYSNRSYRNRERACSHMFSRLQHLVYDPDCNPTGKRDFLRRVPCPQGKLCVDEDAPSNVISDHQFTYVINLEAVPR